MSETYPKAFACEHPCENWNLTNPVLSKKLLSNIFQHCVGQPAGRAFQDGKKIRKALGDLMAQMSASLKDRYALYKLFKLRKRRVLTPDDRLRLRYVALNALLICAAVIHFIPDMSRINLQSSFGSLKLAYSEARQKPKDAMAALDSFAQEALTREGRAEEGEIETTKVMVEDKEIVADVDQVIEEDIPNALDLFSKALVKKPEPTKKIVSIGKGDTISGVLEEAGLSRRDTFYAVEAMSKYLKPRQVKPGQEITLSFAPTPAEDGTSSFLKMVVHITPVEDVVVSKQGDADFSATLKEETLHKRTYAVTTEIETSLYGSALRARIPQSVVAEMIRLYSWSVDFQRDIRSGDKIEVYYETLENEEGDYKQFGDIIYANLGVGGRDKPIYRYQTERGDVDYFEPNGQSIRKTLMRTPIDGARLSSGFGMRRHPILGYNKMHKGVDFAAPTGTPIYAAGDGTIEFIGRNGGYGNFIRIRHNASLKTAYAHLHKFKSGMGKGKRVKQGEVIGYVGTTGRSTGPHLHYEVLQNGVQKNPRSIDLPVGEQLKGTELAKFQTLVSTIKDRYAALGAKLITLADSQF